jgi:hypothetical protein
MSLIHYQQPRGGRGGGGGNGGRGSGPPLHEYEYQDTEGDTIYVTHPKMRPGNNLMEIRASSVDFFTYFSARGQRNVHIYWVTITMKGLTGILVTVLNACQQHQLYHGGCNKTKCYQFHAKPQSVMSNLPCRDPVVIGTISARLVNHADLRTAFNWSAPQLAAAKATNDEHFQEQLAEINRRAAEMEAENAPVAEELTEQEEMMQAAMDRLTEQEDIRHARAAKRRKVIAAPPVIVEVETAPVAMEEAAPAVEEETATAVEDAPAVIKEETTEGEAAAEGEGGAEEEAATAEEDRAAAEEEEATAAVEDEAATKAVTDKGEHGQEGADHDDQEAGQEGDAHDEQGDGDVDQNDIESRATVIGRIVGAANYKAAVDASDKRITANGGSMIDAKDA